MTDRITPAELDALERLCAEATPGPWEVGVEPNGTPGYIYCDNSLGSAVAIAYGRALRWTVFPRSEEEANAAFIAAARRDVPRLVERVRELEAALRSAVKIADEAAIEWDNAPSGMRAGKILLALAGRVPGYRADTDAVHAALKSARAALPEQTP